MRKNYQIILLLTFLFSSYLFAQKNPTPKACNCNLNATVTSTVTCNGGSNGAASANGNSIGIDCVPETFETFQWYNSGGAMAGETNSTISALPAGTYTVEWSNDNCSGITDVITINEPAQPLIASSSHTNETCNQNNGTVQIDFVSNGTSPYTYLWTGGFTTSGVGNRNSGTYNCTVTDAKGCTDTATEVVGNTGTPVTANAASTNTVSCKGGSDGAANVTVSGGGGPPYTYAWSPSGGNSSAATGLAAGNYTVTVTGSNGCTNTDNVSISEPSTALTASTNSTPEICGGNNGGASITPSGGSTPYTYSWSPPIAGNTSAVTGISAGNYDITVTDGNGCVKTFSVNVGSNGSSIVASVSATQTVSCKGLSDGSAAASANSGQAPYTFYWVELTQFGSTMNNLPAGTYNIDVTDANGCTASTSVFIGEPTFSLTATASSNPATCGQNNGDASVNANGGTGAYTYSWSSGGNSATENNLFAGNYTVTVWDANSCSVTDVVNVGTTGGMSVTAAPTQSVSCNGGANGGASVTINTGTAPFTYAWSPSGGNSSAATGLSAGNYTVMVTDVNGCTDMHAVTISEPPVISSSPASTPANCLNAGGTASANASGGVGGFLYVWNPGGQTSPTATGLATGNYTVTITDANSCTKTSTVIVSTATPPVVSTSSTNVTCFGSNNGTATANPSGGTGPFNYLWAPSGGNSQTATGLSPGNYTVTITDANFCTATATSIITQPAVLTASTSVSNASCGGNNGSATATPSGGTSPYTYSWSPSGGTNATANNLSAQGYTVNVTDAKGCLTSVTLNISGTPAASASVVSTSSVTCNGGNDGTASVSAGGTFPFAYAWSPSGGTSSAASNLSGGNYTVTVTDANSCTATSTISVSQPSAINPATNFTQATCGVNDGTATVNVSGGFGPYSYSWSNGATTSSISNLFAGTYTITITDANNCTKVTSVTVTNANAPTLNVTSNNPVSCFGDTDGSASVSASGTNPPFTYSWSPSGGTNSAASNLAAGNYQVIVTDNLGCLGSQTLTIGTPFQVLPTLTSNAISICFGGVTALESTPQGGSPGYIYNWSPGITLDDSTSSKPTASPTVTTVYAVTVTDSKGCTGIDSVTVTVNPLPIITAGSDVAICPSSSTTLNAGGGISYSWTPSSGLSNDTISNPVASPVSTTTYMVTGTDANTCSNTDTIIVSVVQTPTVNISASATTICSGNSVTLSAQTNVTSYSWSTGATTSLVTINPSAPSTIYTLTVSAGTCTADTSIIISAVQTPAASISGNSVLCTGSSQTLTATSGSYNYSWSTTATTSSITISPAANATYTVIVSTTNNLCSDTATFSVIVAPLPFITSSATYTTICVGGSQDTLTASGGQTYVWNPGGQTTSFIVTTYIAVGVYNYTVIGTDTNGCSNTSSLTINATNGFTSPIVNTSGALTICYGDSLLPMIGVPNPSSNGIEWTDPNFSFIVMNDTFYPPQNLQPGNYIFWCMQGTGTSCLSSPTSISVSVLPLPNANAGGDVTLCPGYSTPLTASGGGTYLWAPATDLSGTAISTPTAEPQLTTTYEVMVTDANNCRNRDSVTVYIVLNDTCEVEIYNLISPNTDGKNDEWWIDGIKFFPDNNVQIFNRWGTKVWEGSGYDNEKVVWRGDNQDGKKLPAATYYYILNFGDGSKTKTGFIELVR